MIQHPNFLQNIFPCCSGWNDLLPAIIPVLYSIFGQQLLFKGKHRRVVPIHDHVSRKLKREVKRLKIAIMFRRFRKKGMDLWKQMLSKWSFTCICVFFFARSTFYPQSAVLILHFAASLRFTLSLHSTLSLYFTPDPQCEFYTDRFPNHCYRLTTNTIS